MPGIAVYIVFFALAIAPRVVECARIRHKLGAPQLCDPEIVKETCSLLGDPSSSESDTIYVSRLSHHLQVHEASVFQFFDHIGIENVERSHEMQAAGAVAVSCEDLCWKTVLNLPGWRRPPSSDVICRHTSDLASSIKCDVSVWDLPELPDRTAKDLSQMDAAHVEKWLAEEALAEYSDSKEKEVSPSGVTHADSLLVGEEDASPRNATHMDAFSEEASYLEVSSKEGAHERTPFAEEEAYLEVVIANLFRIYPPPSISVTTNIDEAIAVEQMFAFGEDAERCSVVRNAIPAVGWHLSSGNWCKCPRNMVLAGLNSACGAVKERRKFDPSHLQRKRCYCRQPQFLNVCADASPQCESKKRHCHLPEVQDACPTTCNLNCEDLLHGWKRVIWKASAEAQTFVTKALRLMGTRRAIKSMKFWLGLQSDPFEEEMLRILNAVNKMLLGAEFRYNAPDCKPSVFGYVFQDSYMSKNANGLYVINLCPLWMEASLGGRVETILHEGSHHHRTKDMCTDGIHHGLSAPSCERVYGRHMGRILAMTAPYGAIQNADNICFFIHDVARGSNEIYGPEEAVVDYVERHKNDQKKGV